jgi:7-cyano-7-deazaguanine synthase in queuosine biosynthesis
VKSPKEFLIKSGTDQSFSEADHDYTIVIDDYRQKANTNVERLIKYEKKTLNEIFDGEPPVAVETLVELALGTYAADRLVKRGPSEAKEDGKEMLRSRQIQILYPVADIEKWRPIESELCHAVSFISRDNFQYRFVEAIDESEPSDDTEDYDRIELPEADSVALFSGGLDSLGGRFYLGENGYNPHFLSVDHGRNVGHLIDNLQHLFDGNLTKIPVHEDFYAYEDTQFTRSLMYFAFATAAAIALDVEDIFVPENGILSRFSSLETGWTTTRTVHPLFIKSWNRILAEVFPDRELKLTNPFINLTKAEVINHIPNKEDIFSTRTCPHPRNLSPAKDPAGHPYNCGECVPCLIRIIGLIASDHDIATDELLLGENHLAELNFSDLNVETIASRSSRGRQSDLAVFLLGLNEHLSFANDLQTLSQEELASRNLEFLDPEIYGLYERFSSEVFKTIETFTTGNPSLKLYVDNFFS